MIALLKHLYFLGHDYSKFEVCLKSDLKKIKHRCLKNKLLLLCVKFSLCFAGYMELRTSETTAGLYIPMISPAFEVRQNKCFLFYYNVWMSESNRQLGRSPELEVYISETSHVFSGWKVWGSNGAGEGLVQIPLWAKTGATYRISFVGIINNPSTTLIKVANAKLNQGECNSLNCDSTICADETDISTTKCEFL